MLTQILTHAADLLAAPSPAPKPGSGIVNTSGIIGFVVSWIVPILLALIGVVILGRAKSGNVSSTVTTSGIAMLGVCFIAGAFVFFAVGENVVNVIFGG